VRKVALTEEQYRFLRMHLAYILDQQTWLGSKFVHEESSDRERMILQGVLARINATKKATHNEEKP
jgi:hypothetical protein